MEIVRESGMETGTETQKAAAQPAFSMQPMLALAAECGFEHSGSLNMNALEFLPEVRAMCAEDRCRGYNRRWSCPPACGTLEEIRARVQAFRCGFLVQTTAKLEDDFDYETMMSAEALHKLRFEKLLKRVRALQPDCLPMGAGGCKLCESCTWPDAPCRQPDRMVVSMEAYGLFVSDVCRKSGVGYNYGPQTITYTSCILLRRQPDMGL